MRLEIIRCDVCKKEHDAEYMLPPKWLVVTRKTIHMTEEEYHFCGKACLVTWASKIEEKADE